MSGFDRMIAPNIKRGYEYELATHLRVEIWESFRAAARAITPDMSLPLLVRLLSAKLQARVSANARQGSKRDTTRDHTCSQIWPTHLSEDTLLCLRPSQSAVMPSVVNVPKEGPDTPQSTLSFKLPGTNHGRFQK